MNKAILILFALFLFCFCSFVCADIIEPNTHYVPLCIKISNLGDFNSYTFFNYATLGNKADVRFVKIVSPDACLEKGYKLNSYKLVAIRTELINLPEINSLIKDQKFSSIDFSKAIGTNIELDPAVVYLDNSNPLASENIVYKIMEINFQKVVLVKIRDEKTFNDGSAPQVQVFNDEVQIQSDSRGEVLIDKVVQPNIFELIACFFKSLFGMRC